MYFIRCNPDFKSISAFTRLYSLARKNHYEILNLRRNCTDKEIKQAFIKMSKEYHPDKNKDAKAQANFVRILEAYNVLGKASSRAQYDHMTEFETHSTPYAYKPNVSYGMGSYPNYGFYYENKTKNTNNTEQEKSYYGFAGIKKVPNYIIIAICLGIAVVGAILQAFVIRNLYIIQRKQAQEKSKLLAEELDKVRAAAHSSNNEMQTRFLLEKIVTAANPTVATASLGQALANEKK